MFVLSNLLDSRKNKFGNDCRKLRIWKPMGHAVSPYILRLSKIIWLKFAGNVTHVR